MADDVKKRHRDPLYIFKTLASGAIAGSFSKTVVAPFDRVKIHFQVRNPQFSSLSGTYSGALKAIKLIYSTDGIYGLYRGHLATIVRIVPYAAINYTAYEQFKRLFNISEPTSAERLFAFKKILSGSLSGCISVTLTYPFDILRARMAYVTLTGTKHASQTYLETLKILLSEGQQKHGFRISGLYQGYIPTILGIIPYAGSSFYTFETLKGLYAKYWMGSADHRNASIPPLPKFFCGMLAGVCAQTASYPLDVIRRRSQLWRVAGQISPSDTFTISQTIKVLFDIVKIKGLKELFVGLSINYLKVAPAMGTSFVTYEFLKEHLFHIK